MVSPFFLKPHYQLHATSIWGMTTLIQRRDREGSGVPLALYLSTLIDFWGRVRYCKKLEMR